jgi:IstB-like ATP binding protein
LGYLPIDKRGSVLLFQVVAARYEVGSNVITTSRPFRPFGSQSGSDGSFARMPNVHDGSLPSACWDLLVRLAVPPIDSAKPMKQSGLPLAVSPAPV